LCYITLTKSDSNNFWTLERLSDLLSVVIKHFRHLEFNKLLKYQIFKTIPYKLVFPFIPIFDPQNNQYKHTKDLSWAAYLKPEKPQCLHVGTKWQKHLHVLEKKS